MSIVKPLPRLKTLSHLLLAGHNSLSPPVEYSSRSAQTPHNPALTPVPFALWIGSIGRAADVDAGWDIRGITSGLGHTLISYRSERTDRVFAAGRNEVGQLGVGFNSQESTRNLVEGFKGDSIVQIAASNQSSYILLNENDDTTSLYVAGSLQRGRLGQSRFYSPIPAQDSADQEEPTLHQLAKATAVDLPTELGRVSQIAVGYDHTLILTDSNELYGTGANTDGQLAILPSTADSSSADVYAFTKIELPAGLIADGIASIRAGADTSAIITKSGKLWAWGNSEYGQAAHGSIVPQITSPIEVDTTAWLPTSRRIIDFRCGGSFSILMDSRGSVYSVGFGALGLGQKTIESKFVKRVETLEGEGCTRIRAGWGWAAAVRDDGNDSALWTWGLNNSDGRLGVGSIPSTIKPSTPLNKAVANLSRLPSDKRSLRGIKESSSVEIPLHIYEPTQVKLPLEEMKLGGLESLEDGGARWKFGEVECGDEALWVGLIQEDLGDGTKPETEEANY